MSNVYWTPCDNSKIQIAKQLKVCRINKTKKLKVSGSSSKIVKPGDLIMIFPRKFNYVEKRVQRHKYLGLVAGLKRKICRRGGHYIKGRYNSLLVLSANRKLVGSRIFGPLYREIRQRRNSYIYKKIFSRTGYFI